MKSDESIRNIAVAAVRRHAIEMDSWTRTTVSPHHVPSTLALLPEELPVVCFSIDADNWTLVTTRRVIGAIDASVREVKFNELSDCSWELFKKTKAEHTVFTSTDFHGNQMDFLFETGKPAMGIIYSVKTITALYKCNE